MIEPSKIGNHYRQSQEDANCLRTPGIQEFAILRLDCGSPPISLNAACFTPNGHSTGCQWSSPHWARKLWCRSKGQSTGRAREPRVVVATSQLSLENGVETPGLGMMGLDLGKWDLISGPMTDGRHPACPDSSLGRGGRVRRDWKSRGTGRRIKSIM